MKHWFLSINEYFKFDYKEVGERFYIQINTPLFAWIYLGNWKYWTHYAYARGYILAFLPKNWSLYCKEGDFMYRYDFEVLEFTSCLEDYRQSA